MSSSRRDWRARFEALAARKTRVAMEASLHSLVTDVAAPAPSMIDIGNAWSRQLYDGPFYLSPPRDSRRPGCSLVFVQSADGNTGAKDPASLGAGDTDTHLIYEGLSRVGADAVLAGAGTARGGDILFSVWHPELIALRASLGLPRHPVQIVASRRGVGLDGMLIFNVPDIRVVLLAGPEAAQHCASDLRTRPWVTTVPVEEPYGLSRAFEQLRAMGIARISCVGGRTLARELLDGTLVSDVYLTTSPKPGGEPGTPISDKPWRGRLVARKHCTGPESGVVFEHVLPR